MITRHKLPFALLALLLCFSSLIAQAGDAQQDAKAIDILKQMAAFKSSLDKVTIRGVTFTDARLGAGLMVSNSEEVRVSINKPGSLQITNFDGESSKSLYFDDGTLTVISSAANLYAQASIPKDIDAALEFSLEELGIEAPLMDMIYQDASAHLISSNETILYLTNKSRVGKTDCHQIAIRGPEADVQLWIEEGDRPLVRKIVITSKWEGGSPRFIANLHWETNPKFDPGYFEFKAPEGATKIKFVRESSAQ